MKFPPPRPATDGWGRGCISRLDMERDPILGVTLNVSTAAYACSVAGFFDAMGTAHQSLPHDTAG